MLSLFTLAAMLATQGPTGTITGRVLAAGSELPIAEAIVTVEGIEARATTTASGMFRLEGIPPGIYTVRAVAVGYAPAVRTDVAVGTARPVEIAFLLSPRPIELAELSVEAAPYFTPPGTRLPTFHALDLRADRRWNWRGVQLVTYLDVQNIYNRKNVSQFTWNERKQRVEADESLGVLPSLGVRVEF